MKDSILSYLNKNSLLASFVLAGIILLIILSTLPVRYIVNDDFAMITILRGNDFFSPSFHAVFLNPVMSWFLYSLYKLFPSIPWFGIVIYSTHLLGWSLIFSVVLRSDKLLYLVLSLPFLLACYVYHSCMVTFTSSSLFLLFGVLSCSFVFLSDKLSPINNRTSYSIFLALCFFLSFLLRWELVLYSILLGLPLIFFVKWQQVKIVIPLITILALLVCLNIGFIKIFESQEQPFYEYNKLRGDFHGTPKGDDNGQITLRAADKIGWDYEDYFSFRYYWLIFDNYTFNTHNLRIFLNENDLQKNLISNIPHIMGNISGSIKISAKDTLLFIISIASLFVFKAKYLINYNKIELFKILLTLVFYCISILFFMYYRFVPWVYIPLYTYIFVIFFILLDIKINISKKIKDNHTQSILIYAILALCFISVSYISYNKINECLTMLKWSDIYKNKIKEYFDTIQSTYPISNTLIVPMIPVPGLLPELVHPLKEYSDYTQYKIFPTGWMVNSPYYNNILKKMGLNNGHDFLKWLVNRKNILIFLLIVYNNKKEGPQIVYLWKSYYTRHIFPGINVQLVPVYDFRNNKGLGAIFFQIKTLK